jgi:hypothetical protein
MNVRMQPPTVKNDDITAAWIPCRSTRQLLPSNRMPSRPLLSDSTSQNCASNFTGKKCARIDAVCYLHIKSAAAEGARAVAVQSEEAAQVRRGSLAAAVAGVAALNRDKRVQEVETTYTGMSVAGTVHDAAVGRRLPAGCCGELDLAVHVARETHRGGAASDCVAHVGHEE